MLEYKLIHFFFMHVLRLCMKYKYEKMVGLKFTVNNLISYINIKYLGELFQEQAGLVLEQSSQKHAHLLVKDCYR